MALSSEGGSLLTFVRKDIPYKRSRDAPTMSPMETLSIMIPSGGGGNIGISNFYLPPARHAAGEDRGIQCDGTALPR